MPYAHGCTIGHNRGNINIVSHPTKISRCCSFDNKCLILIHTVYCAWYSNYMQCVITTRYTISRPWSHGQSHGDISTRLVAESTVSMNQHGGGRSAGGGGRSGASGISIRIVTKGRISMHRLATCNKTYTHLCSILKCCKAEGCKDPSHVALHCKQQEHLA
jgi:hypothetical protein